MSDMGIRELRQKRGMTQSELSLITGLPRTKISDYETGRIPISNITVDTALKLLDALGEVNPRTLFND